MPGELNPWDSAPSMPQRRSKEKQATLETSMSSAAQVRTCGNAVCVKLAEVGPMRYPSQLLLLRVLEIGCEQSSVQGALRKRGKEGLPYERHERAGGCMLRSCS